MRLQDDLDFTTLNWVKQELDETLKQARQALEAYVEDPADSSLMRFCATYLHQVQGTLRMVELYGAAMVVEEMERVANAVLDGHIRQKDETYSVLMRGIVQLPDYLERLQSGHKDIPIVLLPLLNDLRACRGEKLLSESVLFSPDLATPLPRAAAGPDRPVPELELKALSARLRTNFQTGLLHWFRNANPQEAIGGLMGTLERLRAITTLEEARRLWWVGTGVLDAILAGGIDPSAALKVLFGRVDREIKRLADVGEQSFRVDPPRELTKNLLYYVAHSRHESDRVREIRRTYRLDALLPSEQELAHAKGSLAGKNRALLDTVSIAIKDDLMRVKDALDLHLRTHDAKPADLASQGDVLDRVADTLGMLGLGVPRRVVQEQRQALTEIATGARKSDEGALLDIAGALLYVEASLDDNIETLGGIETAPMPAPVAGGPLKSADLELPQTEVRKILDALLKEASVNLALAKQEIVAFVESPWDHAKVVHIPRLLEEIAGAMRMLDLGEPATLLGGLVRFVEVELIRLKRVPTTEQMDRLADSLASVEYYLEAVRDQRLGREKILEVTRRSLEALGYWPVPEGELPEPATELEEVAGAALEQVPPQPIETDMTRVSFGTAIASGADAMRIEPAPAGAADIRAVDLPSESIEEFLARIERGEAPEITAEMPAPAAPPAAPEPPMTPRMHDVVGLKFAETEKHGLAEPDEEFEWVEIEEEVEEDAEAEAPAAGGFQAVPSDDIDDEIREVFVEEVQEEIENINRQLPGWKNEQADLEKLKPLRRAFHTLKGSGRLVGAMALGEFSWRIENMLNRVLDKTIHAGPAVVALIDRAVEALPQMLAALRGEGAPRAPIADIMAVAEKLAAGEEAWVRGPQKVTVKRTRRVRVVKPRPPAVAAPAPVESAAAIEPVAIERAAVELVADPIELDETLDITSALEIGEPEAEVVTLESLISFDLPVAAPIEPAPPVVLEPEAAPERMPEPAAETPRWLEPLEAAPAAAAGPIMPALDPMLLEILRSEVEGHLATVREYLESCARSGAQPASEALLRAVHTMHGAVSMADVPAINEVVGPLEGFVKRLRASGDPPTAEGIAAIGDTARLIGDVIAQLDRPGVALPAGGELAHRLDALRGGLPEPETAFSVFDLALEDDEATPAAPVAPEVEEPVVSARDSMVEAIEVSEPAAASMDTFLDELPPMGADVGGAELGVTPEPGLISIGGDATGAMEEIPDLADEFETALAHLESAPTAPPMSELEALAAELADAAPPPAIEIHARPAEPAPLAAAALAPREVPVEAPPIADDPDPEGALSLPDMDEDLIEIFVEEGNDILDKADTLVARLRDQPNSHDAIGGLQRHLHTLKGNARAVGLAGIGDLSHAMESLLEGVAGDRLAMNRVAVESLERGFDRLHRMVTRVARRQAVGIPANAIARYAALVAGEVLEPVAEAPAPVVAAPTVAPVAPALAAPAPEQVAAAAAPAAPKPKPAAPRPAPAVEPAIEDEIVPRAPQEMIRVRSDLLDALVNFAGEVSIYRSRLEQQLGTFRFNLVELEQTVARLRDQLRKMEVETEAQILSRYQREAEQGGAEAVFDPLELDRFSTVQQLSRALAESVSDLVALQTALDDLTRQSETLLLQQSRVSSELQEGLMRTRMVPFDSVVPFLRRLMRQTADELGKRATLKVEGAQGEMDRNLLERMKAPFEHMLRNAIAHGIEGPGERSGAGKPEEGLVRIAVSREATEVVIRVSDDGKGMDRDAIRTKAIERGLMRPDAQLSDRDLFGFVLETGFSTALQVTKIAGRGVGMDVVASEIKQLGGSLAIDSTRGRGTEFTIRLPFTLAVTQAIMVRLGDQSFAVPMSSVQGVARIARDDLDRRLGQSHPSFSYAGDDYHIHELNMLLGLPSHRASDDAQLPLLLARTGDQRAAIRVDAVMGSREIVVKSVGPQVSSVPGIFGATIMGDGSVVMILDLAPLVRRSAALREEVAIEAALEEALPGIAVPVAPAPMAEPRRQPLVMVVDDSITMRKVTSRVLERHDMEVVTAKDGLDAVEKLQDRIPDLMLLDIEMPRMDGYELATYMRNDPRLKTVPIIMITSRTGEKHRQRAFEIGVDRYLGKPYQEADLLRNVEETLRLSRAVH